MRIGIYLEYDGNKLTASSNELLVMAADFAGSENITAFAAASADAEIEKLPAAKVYSVENAVFGSDLAKPIAEKAAEWDWFMAPMTLNGREVAAYLKMLTDGELVYGVSGLKAIDNEIGKIKVTKLTAGGLTQEYKEFTAEDKVILGIVPGLWNEAAAKNGSAVVEKVSAEVQQNAKLQKEYLAPWTEIAVNEAKIVVAGGNGMEAEDNFNLLYGIGELLEAPIGGSRVAEDKGWIEHKSMIGATGSVIAPKLYIACGISGAVQHLVGVQGSEKTISVNTDAMCGMMQNSDLAVVGDCKEILPILIEKLKKYKRTEAI